MNKKLLKVGAGLAAALMLMAFLPFFLTTVAVRIVGPYYTSPQAFDSTSANQVGGHVQYYLAGDTVRIGHLVYLSAKNTVKESATISDYNAIIGVVVGGTRTSMQASISRADTSTVAAILGQRAIVLDVGRYWVVDSAGAITSGTRVRPSATKGRMAAVTTAIDSAYRVFGRTVDTTITGTIGLVQIHVK